MLYIFEGVDGAGKTTLIQEVHKHTQIPIIKMPKAIENFRNPDILNALSHNYDLLLEQLAQTNYDFLVDRGFLTGIVYNDVFKRGYDTSYVDRILQEHENSITFFILSDSIEEILQRKSDEIIASNRIVDVWCQYEEFVENNSLKHIYKITGSINEKSSAILSLIKLEQSYKS